ncbi:MAG: SUMF1/EgtB/PvdO family nonheme iron enzyme, partial [Planctomycetota bacterium]
MKTRTLIRSVLLLAPIALSTLGSTAPAQDTGSESAEKAAGARDDRAGMVRIAGGSTRLGAGDERRDVDALEVELAPFWIDAREVTNADFARF